MTYFIYCISISVIKEAIRDITACQMRSHTVHKSKRLEDVFGASISSMNMECLHRNIYIVRVSQCVFYVSCLPSLSAKWRRQAWIQRRHHMVTSGAFLHLAYEIPPPSCTFRPALARWPKYRQRHFGIVIVLHRIRDICFKCSCWKDEPSSSSESSTSSEDCPHTGATRVLRCWYHFCSLITAQKQL